jgi:hypothetical protein
VYTNTLRREEYLESSWITAHALDVKPEQRLGDARHDDTAPAARTASLHCTALQALFGHNGHVGFGSLRKE